jgi:hypothetical protein
LAAYVLRRNFSHIGELNGECKKWIEHGDVCEIFFYRAIKRGKEVFDVLLGFMKYGGDV